MKEYFNIPKPGKPARGTTTGKPVMVLFDLLGRRWAMSILWHLHDRNRTFREIQECCDNASPTVLNTRLKELRMSGLVKKAERGYALTQTGNVLYSHLEPLDNWADEWAENFE